jgi:hypothetical protein
MRGPARYGGASRFDDSPFSATESGEARENRASRQAFTVELRQQLVYWTIDPESMASRRTVGPWTQPQEGMMRIPVILLTLLAVPLLASGQQGAKAQLTYLAGAAQAVRAGQPLVTFLGCPERAVEGAVVARSETLAGYDGPAVVVAVPGGGWLEHRATLPANASDAQIAAAIRWQANEALAEVNATRATRGLPPYIEDASLTAAAVSAANFRAAKLIAGHTTNDFAHLPAGAHADAAGCAAWTPDWGWGACATYDNFTHAGAAIAFGTDGRRYMHLFVRR